MMQNLIFLDTLEIHKYSNTIKDSNIIVIFLLEKNWDIIFKVKGILKGIHPQYSWIVVQRDIAVT